MTLPAIPGLPFTDKEFKALQKHTLWIYTRTTSLVSADQRYSTLGADFKRLYSHQRRITLWCSLLEPGFLDMFSTEGTIRPVTKVEETELWCPLLPMAEFAYNNTVHYSTGVTRALCQRHRAARRNTPAIGGGAAWTRIYCAARRNTVTNGG
ncbi:hypothetical protein B0O80DRAFT_495644 [Mortierella sp. GBAus27b]|nr:hypothetical protein B0O80DRAFT_495644 [Mortierella sp. GBAus27b]